MARGDEDRREAGERDLVDRTRKDDDSRSQQDAVHNRRTFRATAGVDVHTRPYDLTRHRKATNEARYAVADTLRNEFPIGGRGPSKAIKAVDRLRCHQRLQ